MTTPQIRVAQPADLEALLDTLVLAFSADPPARYSWPTAQAFIPAWRRLVTALGGRALEHGTAHLTQDGQGVGLWLPPGVEPDGDALGALLEDAISPEKQPEVAAVLEEMSQFHPQGPHWYLAVLGVDPCRQGQGVGSILMKHALQLCDAEGLPAYLEASNAKNVPFYERHGFEVLGAIKPGEFPTLYPMLRPARR